MSRAACVNYGAIAVGFIGFFYGDAVRAGFIEDAHASLGTRNAYIDRGLKQSDAPKSRLGSWTQGFYFRLMSSYTPFVQELRVLMATY